MLLDENALGAYVDHCDYDAFRHETLPRYQVASDGGDLARYLAGEPAPDPAVVEPWGRWIRGKRDQRVTVRRVRVLHEPPGEYLRWEIDWVYRANAAAGEETRILDLTEHPRPYDLLDVEFWMLDGERVALMRYDDEGRYLHAEAIEGRAALRYRRAADAVWSVAEPLTEWWTRHPEYHRVVA